MKTNSEIVPLLVVQGAADAIDFYVRALGATVTARYEHGAERRISHADLALSSSAFAVTEEARAWNSDAPPSIGGSPVVLQLSIVDADAVLASMCNLGATVVFPMQELLGERMARVRDPFGHVWILRQRLVELSVDEIQKQRDELFARLGAEAGPPAAAPARVENATKLQDSNGTRQAPGGITASTRHKPGGVSRVGRVHLLIGPVGAGKSTFALQLAREHAAARLTLDEWMTVLFREDRPGSGVIDWYMERAARCIEQIWRVAKGLVEIGSDVVLEIGLLSRRERESFYRRVRDAGFDSTIYVLDAARDVRRHRVEERNRTKGSTFSMVVPPEIFELASDHWEPPSALECSGRDVRFIWTDAP